MPIEATFSGYENKKYIGEVDSVASRINAETRSLLVRIKITNDNSELIPGALLEVAIRYNEKNSLGIPDTALLLEGNKKYVYKVLENNTIEKIEIETGIRNKGNLEVVSGLQKNDKIVAEGLGKTNPGLTFGLTNTSCNFIAFFPPLVMGIIIQEYQDIMLSIVTSR